MEPNGAEEMRRKIESERLTVCPVIRLNFQVYIVPNLFGHKFNNMVMFLFFSVIKLTFIEICRTLLRLIPDSFRCLILNFMMIGKL
jgi:hypothetical protein